MSKEKRIAEVANVKDTSETELKLLLVLENTISGDAATYSISQLARDIDTGTAEVMSALESLEQKGYLRHWRVGKASVNDTLQERAAFSVKRASLALDKIEKLQEVASRTSKQVYGKIMNELVSELSRAAAEIGAVRETYSRELSRLVDAIGDIREKEEEVRLRMAIGQIEGSEAERLLKLYSKDVETLEGEISKLRLVDRSDVKNTPNTKKDEQRLSQINQALEILWARLEVGEISNSQYSEQKAKLERQRQQIAPKLHGDTEPYRAALGELKAKVSKLRDSKAIPAKTAAQLISALERP